MSWGKDAGVAGGDGVSKKNERATKAQSIENRSYGVLIAR